VPTFPATSHAAHCAPHPLSQHTPSTQNPVPHSALVAHATPIGLLHLPAAPTTLHLSPELHALALQHTPSTQFPDAHELAPNAVQLVPSGSLPVHAPDLQ
jgi:hypothetical protein